MRRQHHTPEQNGGRKATEAKRLKELEQANAKLQLNASTKLLGFPVRETPPTATTKEGFCGIPKASHTPPKAIKASGT
jgi:hypothetical protein